MAATQLLFVTVEPPLTATSPQRPLLFVAADGPCIDFCLIINYIIIMIKIIPESFGPIFSKKLYNFYHPIRRRMTDHNK